MDILETSETCNVKNRMRELRSSGSVRGEGGNIPRLLGKVKTIPLSLFIFLIYGINGLWAMKENEEGDDSSSSPILPIQQRYVSKPSDIYHSNKVITLSPLENPMPLIIDESARFDFGSSFSIISQED